VRFHLKRFLMIRGTIQWFLADFVVVRRLSDVVRALWARLNLLVLCFAQQA